jgi:uncharacterized protein
MGDPLAIAGVKHEEEILMMTNPFKDRCLARCIKQSFVIAVWLIVMLAPSSSPAFDIHIGTQESGSFSHFIGRTICRIINMHIDDLQCSVVPATNHVHNLTNLQGGSLDICLVDSRMLYDAVAGKGLFEFFDISYDNLREMITLYELPMTLVVRSNAGINSLDDLKGKRINAGAPRSSQHFVINTIMDIKTWSAQDFSLLEELPPSLSQDTMAFCHGSIQAMVNIAVHPDPSIQQLFNLCNGRLLNLGPSDIDALLESHPAFIKIDIAPNTYALHPERVTTFGTTIKLVTSDSLDDETGYQIIEALHRGRKYLKTAHPALGAWTPNAAEKTAVSIKLHSGAIKYYSGQ